MLKPVAVATLPGYKLRVEYTDGVTGEVDLSHLVGKGRIRGVERSNGICGRYHW